MLFPNCHRDVLQCGVINPCAYIPGRQRAGYFNDPYQQAYMQTTLNYLLVNLAVADMISAL